MGDIIIDVSLAPRELSAPKTLITVRLEEFFLCHKIAGDVPR